jgi:hypothetical protein
MELTLTIILGLIIGALICEFIDSALGMLYGTILSPVLVIAGFDPLLVVPSILFSQAIGGFTASIFHHRLKNADFTLKIKNTAQIADRLAKLGYKESFNRGTTQDLKVAICITVLGIFAAIAATLIAINIPKIALTTYIGTLVALMGIIILTKINFKFSWKKMLGVGILSAFNKGMSGGGFGPVVTAGQIISGRDGKSSIGATTLAEAPICMAGFLTYLLTKGISNWSFVFLLSSGAIMGAALGPFFTAKFKSKNKLKIILGVLTLGLGLFVLINAWYLKIKGASA